LESTAKFGGALPPNTPRGYGPGDSNTFLYFAIKVYIHFVKNDHLSLF